LPLLQHQKSNQIAAIFLNKIGSAYQASKAGSKKVAQKSF
jgi:hypothetical protein